MIYKVVNRLYAKLGGLLYKQRTRYSYNNARKRSGYGQNYHIIAYLRRSHNYHGNYNLPKIMTHAARYANAHTRKPIGPFKQRHNRKA